jgi:hypothetical protein
VSEEPDWDDATQILAALMRLNSRVDELAATLNEIKRLLGDDDGQEESDF